VGAKYTGRRDVDPALFRSGEDVENAIVDFKYSADPRVTWWFDHHRSTFPTEADARHYEADRSGQRVFDPRCPSCARLIACSLADELRDGLGVMEDLVDWADRIDTADFVDAAEAVELTAPALRLGLVIQTTRDPEFVSTLLDELQREPLDVVERRPYVASRFAVALVTHRASIEAVRRSSRVEGEVFFFDVADHVSDRIDRYIPFYLEPEVQYSVGVARSPGGLKVGISFNPWSDAPRQHDIAEICRALAGLAGIEGAGGHSTIGGIPFDTTAYDSAVEIARLAVSALAEPGTVRVTDRESLRVPCRDRRDRSRRMNGTQNEILVD
jgi:hypothetical protein